jgi:hypothetical protein
LGLHRAARTTAALGLHAEGFDAQAFEDRLPYVLELLAGVRRQIHEYKRRTSTTAAFDAWWASEWSDPRWLEMTNLRHVHLKQLESGAQTKVHTQSNLPAGTFLRSKCGQRQC